MTTVRKPRETKDQRKERQAEEELRFVAVLRKAGNIVEPEVLVPNQDGRKWRVDYLMPRTVPSSAAHPYLGFNLPIALEIEGYGRHQSWSGWHGDLAKYNQIAANRWLLVRVTREMVASGDALEALVRCGVRVESRTPIMDNIDANGGVCTLETKMRFPKFKRP